MSIRYLLLLLYGITAAACTRHIHYPVEAQPPAARSEAHMAQFNYEPTPIIVESEPILIKQRQLRHPSTNRWYRSDRLGGHIVKRLTFASSGNNRQPNNQISMRYYQSQRPGKKPLVIVLPIYGSYTYPAEKIAGGVRKRYGSKVNVALLEAENFLLDFEGLAEIQTEAEFQYKAQEMYQNMLTSIIDVRRLIDWAEQQPEIDAKHIGLVGFSMSALTASMAAIVEPRLKATVIVMGAAQPQEVLSVCPGRPGRAREAVLTKLDWTTADYRQQMTAVFSRLDPMQYPGLADPAKILMIDAHYDDCMPTATREALWQALGYPERISYMYTHKKAFLPMTPLGFNTQRREIYRFLAQGLELIK